MSSAAATRRKLVAALYAKRPDEFVAARKQAVKEHPDQPWLKDVRKPSPVLWALNALAREGGAELKKLLALDATLAPEARGQQRELINHLVERADAILVREGSVASRANERRLRAALQAAALAAPDQRADLAAGALEVELDASSIDLLGSLQASQGLTPTRPPSRDHVPSKAERAKQHRAEQAERKARQEEERRAAEAEKRVATLLKQAARAESKVTELEHALEDARAEVRRLHEEAREARAQIHR
jgi:hypothetical protein